MNVYEKFKCLTSAQWPCNNQSIYYWAIRSDDQLYHWLISIEWLKNVLRWICSPALWKNISLCKPRWFICCVKWIFRSKNKLLLNPTPRTSSYLLSRLEGKRKLCLYLSFRFTNNQEPHLYPQKSKWNNGYGLTWVLFQLISCIVVSYLSTWFNLVDSCLHLNGFDNIICRWTHSSY